MLGAPLGAWTSLGKSVTESFGVRPIWPRKGDSGAGQDVLRRGGPGHQRAQQEQQGHESDGQRHAGSPPGGPGVVIVGLLFVRRSSSAGPDR
jgi:hypothetical protein